MNKIKVMMVIQHMGAGGAQRIVLNYLNDLKDDDKIELKLFVGNSGKIDENYKKEIKENNLDVVFLQNSKKIPKIPVLKKLIAKKTYEKMWLNAIKEYNPDIIHIHIAELVDYLIKPIKSLKKKNVFVHLHGHPLRSNWLMRKKLSKCFNKYHFIPICVNKDIGKAAIKYYKCNNYEIIYNGIDIKNIKEKIISKKEARKKIKIDDNTFLMLGVGRLNKVKRFDLLISIFNEYYKCNNNSKLIIVGDGPEKNNLVHLVNKMELNNNVVLCGNQSDVIKYYCAADVLLITSKVESASLVLLEAQTCKTKCIISSNIPSESIVSNNVIRIKNDLDILEWIYAIKNNNYCKKNNDIIKYDVHKVSLNMKDIYIKYFNNNN